MTHTDVLIVGGGPSGLMAASLLSIYGVDFRLIDKKAGISGNSRALSIHARTLELFEQMGVVEDFLALGRPVRGITLAEAGRRTDFDVFTAGGDITRYNMSLILEQNKTERLLLDFVERAGHALAWETALTELTQTEDGVRVELEGADGSGETVHARYVLAADGASSTVRKSVDVAFTGDTVEQRFLVMDATVNQDFDDGTMTLNLNANGPIALIPLTVDGRFRIISTLPVGFEGEDPTAQDYADFLRDHFPGGLDVSDYEWFSPYRIHSRSVQHFRVGNVLFIGDAAHVHTPVGGQGMNTGLQDAHNLVWKLALVLRGGMPQTALDSYDTERHPVAKRLLDTTDRLFQAASQGGAVARFIRGYLFTPVLRSIAGWEMMQRRWFPTMAMTGIGYDEGLLVKDDGRGVPRRAPAPGERWPYTSLDYRGDEVSSYAMLDYAKHHLFVFAPSVSDELRAEAAGVEQSLPVVVHFVTSEAQPRSAPDNIFRTDAETLARFHGHGDATAYLVRPDAYVAHRRPLDGEGLREVLSAYFGEIAASRKHAAVVEPA